MTDKELLELAAKAAGIEGEWLFDVYRQGEIRNGLWDDLNETCWNPLTDDGDALRLAVKLGIDISFSENAIYYPINNTYYFMAYIDDLTPNNIRHLIVRAAAEIGKEITN